MTADPRGAGQRLANRTFGPSFVRHRFELRRACPRASRCARPPPPDEVDCSQPVVPRSTTPASPADWYLLFGPPGRLQPAAPTRFRVRRPGHGVPGLRARGRRLHGRPRSRCTAPTGNQNHRVHRRPRLPPARRRRRARRDERHRILRGVRARCCRVVDAPFLPSRGQEILPMENCKPGRARRQGAWPRATCGRRSPSRRARARASIPQPFVDRSGFHGNLIYTLGESLPHRQRLADRSCNSARRRPRRPQREQRRRA